jgi:hypothetical protein
MCANQVPDNRAAAAAVTAAIKSIREVAPSVQTVVTGAAKVINSTVGPTLRQWLTNITYYPALIWQTAYSTAIVLLFVIVVISAVMVAFVTARHCWRYRAARPIEDDTTTAPAKPRWLRRQLVRLVGCCRKTVRAMRIPIYRTHKHTN